MMWSDRLFRPEEAARLRPRTDRTGPATPAPGSVTPVTQDFAGRRDHHVARQRPRLDPEERRGLRPEGGAAGDARPVRRGVRGRPAERAGGRLAADPAGPRGLARSPPRQLRQRHPADAGAGRRRPRVPLGLAATGRVVQRRRPVRELPTGDRRVDADCGPNSRCTDDARRRQDSDRRPRGRQGRPPRSPPGITPGTRRPRSSSSTPVQRRRAQGGAAPPWRSSRSTQRPRGRRQADSVRGATQDARRRRPGARELATTPARGRPSSCKWPSTR